MCGIIAIAGKDVTEESLLPALKSLAKRGPDDHGVLVLPGIALGQTRLAIVDLSPGGHQPKQDNKEKIAITFNGEIYNYKELRAELETRGHQFSTQSDTEVILKSYLEYGEKCPEYLDGMFAFALWDERNQELFLARDRFGKKPLYYAYNQQGNLVVGSEIKALIASGVKPEIDPAGIDLYLTLMYIPPWRSVYKNIHVIPPAHHAVYKNGSMHMKQYWKLDYKPLSVSYEDAKNEVRRLFDDAVRKRMIADVEVGALLSGGVDSTLVCAYAQKHMSNKLKTFSLGYGDAINELPYAKQASEKIGTDHYTLQASSDLTEELEKVMEYFDEPHGDSADFPQHLVSELASSKVKVALAGDGGDELFLGYGWYFSYWNSRKIVRLKNMLFSNPYREHLRNITVFPASMRRALWRTPVKEESIEQLVEQTPGNGTQKINMFDLITYLPGQLLTKVDRAGGMHGLEVRCPLLDHTLAEYVFNLPEEYKMDKKTGKLILKDLLSEIMPREFVDRKKQGFGAPVRKWLKEEKMRAYVEKQFAPGARVYDFLHEKVVRDFLQNAYANDNPKSYYRLWVLLCLEIWLKKHPS